MAIFAPNHRPIGKTTHAAGTAGAHVRYITRDGAAGLVMGEHMPTGRNEARAWMDEREAADRKNGRVCDKLMLPLPLELDAAGRADLVREFMHDVGGGRVSWLAAVHDRGKDEGNPHAHVILRDKDHETGKRVFGTSEKGSTDRIRELWETAINRALEREGIDARVDRRSLADQQLDREPGIHVGPNVRAMEKRGLRPESMAQDHTTSRGNERVVNWPEIDQGRTRADRQREIEAMNRQAEAERGKEKGRQEAELAPAEPAQERQPKQLHELAAENEHTLNLDTERNRLAQLAEQALQAMERTLADVAQERVAAILRGLDDRARDVSNLIPTPGQEREAPAQERVSGGMEVAALSREATQRASYEVAVREPDPKQVEIRLERSRLAQFVAVGRERLAALAGRLEQAFQAVRHRQEDRQPIHLPEPPQIPQQRPAAEPDPWGILNEPRRSLQPKEPEREKERDTGRSLWEDFSRGRERDRKGPSW